MDKKNIAFIIIIIMLIVAFSIVSSYFVMQKISMRNDFYNKVRNFEHSLSEKVTLQKASVESPAVIIDVDEIEFLKQIYNLNATVVYIFGPIDAAKLYCDFYVLNPSFTIAYRYTIM